MDFEDEGDADWGDMDDNFMLTATQQLEEAEVQKMQQQNTRQPTTAVREMGGRSAYEATQAFNLRRLGLEQKQDSEPFQLSEKMLAQEPQKCARILYDQLVSEKSKTQALQNDLFAAKGESENLRRRVESLNKTQQADVLHRMNKEREEKRRYEAEIKKLSSDLTSLRTDLRRKEDEVAQVKSKAAMMSCGRLSVGGAHSSQMTTQMVTTQSLGGGNQTGTSFRSDPNLSTKQQKAKSLPSQVAVPPPVRVDACVSPAPPRPKLADQEVQFDCVAMENETRDELVFQNDGHATKINFSQLESVQRTEIPEVRRELFSKLRQLNELEFCQAKPELHKIVQDAPVEIMCRFVRGKETKAAFPDVTDSMFRSGIAHGRKKEAEKKREPAPAVQYPKLPAQNSPPVVDFDKVMLLIESIFIQGSAWEALREIKGHLKQFLQSIEGDRRFKLYEEANVCTFWKLLTWTTSMWKFIEFEEEIPKFVQAVKKDVWVQELREWSGLILKVDWRDFPVPELETIVRKHSLKILELIVKLGYFEQLQRRYEILFCIIKDTLLKDHHRFEGSLRCCLTIITWLVADKTIFKYLCLGQNDGNCLAHMLGENVLQCFKDTEDPYCATSLLVSYFNLLESLMLERPKHFYTSQLAQPVNNVFTQLRDSDSPEAEIHVENSEAGNEMEVDIHCSQFADGNKYKLENAGRTRLQKASNVIQFESCWISPKEWEMVDKNTEDPRRSCQCRKSLLGNAFIMLNSVLQFWKDAYFRSEEELSKTDFERGIEVKDSGREKAELQAAFINKVLEKEGDTRNDFRKASRGSEWTWDELLEQNKQLISTQDQDWICEKRRPDNLFDYSLRRGVLLMNFCYNENRNMASAIGSEAFLSFTMISSDLRHYVNNIHFTDAERLLISEFTPLSDESDESLEDVGISNNFENIRRSENLLIALDLDELPNGIPSLPLLKPTDKDFERRFMLLEHELNM